MGEEGGFAAYRAEGADGRVHSAGEDRFGALLKKVGASVREGHLVQYRSVERGDDRGGAGEDHWAASSAV